MMKKINNTKTPSSLIALIFLAGCGTTTPDWGKYRGIPHTHEVFNNKKISHDELSSAESTIEAEAKHLDLSVVNYLHQVNTNKIKRVTAHDLLPDPFYGHEISSLLVKMSEAENLKSSKDFVLYQAWDERYPHISPAFTSAKEAQEYADGNNVSDGASTGHKYIVREIDYRYEVRHQNDSVNDVIFTASTLNEAEKYLNTYRAFHTDLLIFDLRTGEIVGVNTP